MPATAAVITPNGFREYDARWLYPKEIDLPGLELLGLGLGTYFHELGVRPAVASGHDYRSYSPAVQEALVSGLIRAGCQVFDIGLALTPTCYFAQYALDVPCCAMVTASHNENGWTGVKMGANRPLTFGPQEITRLKEIVLGRQFRERPGGSRTRVPTFRERYIDDLVKGHTLSRPMRVLVACGNGTAGVFAPETLSRIGAEVVPMDCELDYTFPRYNPNTEDLKMLHAMAEGVLANACDIGIGIDGDGDRCGVVDDQGHEIFADKVGVLLARDFSARHRGAKFVVDVKSTALYETDPLLRANGASVDYWKTGHSYIKSRTAELHALAGIEKSGHYFFNPPIARGYDDGLVAAIQVLEMLDRAGGKKISQLVAGLPKTWGSPTMAPFCPDDKKYAVVDAVTKEYEGLKARGEKVLGSEITRLVTVNGVRVTLADGTWGLVRASSNKPSLVVVCESPVSEARLKAMFADIDARLKKHPEVGEYDQKI